MRTQSFPGLHSSPPSSPTSYSQPLENLWLGEDTPRLCVLGNHLLAKTLAGDGQGVISVFKLNLYISLMISWSTVLLDARQHLNKPLEIGALYLNGEDKRRSSYFQVKCLGVLWIQGIMRELWFLKQVDSCIVCFENQFNWKKKTNKPKATLKSKDQTLERPSKGQTCTLASENEHLGMKNKILSISSSLKFFCHQLSCVFNQFDKLH